MRITTKENDIESILYSEKQIAAMVETLGEKLTEDYAGKRPVMVCVLKGASVFFTDLCREIDLNLDMDFISVSSYGMSSKSSGVVKLNKDVDIDITGRDVILVDDIIDSGLTLQHLKQLFSTRGPSSVKTIALLDKKVRHDPALTPDYIGFQCPDHFVVGYGLDSDEHYRNLPYVGILKREVYK